MKVLLTIFDITTFGGTERMVINLAEYLAQNNIQVSILSFYQKYKYSKFNLPENIHIFYAKNSPPPAEYQSKRKAVYALWFNIKLKKFLNSFDIIISHDYDVLWPYFKGKNQHYIKVTHGNYRNTYRHCRVLHLFDTLVILCNKELPIYQKLYKGNLAVIPNFILKMPKENALLKEKAILFVGRLSGEKGLLRLVEIWNLIQEEKKYANWKLHIVGDGSFKKDLEQEIRFRGLNDSILVKSFIQEIDQEYLNASIYAMTSFFEGLPMVLLEAISYGLPVVSFDIYTGPSDVIEDGKSGFLVKDHDLEDFAKKLQLLMDDENLRQAMGMRAKEIAQEKFSGEVVFQKWQKLLQQKGIT